MGVAHIICSHDRSTVVACSVWTVHYYDRWITKAPGTLSQATNLLRIFTPDVWLYILLSTALFSGFLLLAAKIGSYYGVITMSYYDFLVPFRQALIY